VNSGVEGEECIGSAGVPGENAKDVGGTDAPAAAPTADAALSQDAMPYRRAEYVRPSQRSRLGGIRGSLKRTFRCEGGMHFTTGRHHKKD